MLTQIQDEVHRFAITFHRDKRSKHQLHSELDDIKGIGPKTRDELLHKFRSVARIKAASEADIEAVIGPAKTAILLEHFNNENNATAADK